jgi:hypothetical protein
MNADPGGSGSTQPVFRIHDILAWIRIRGSTPLTNGSGSCYFLIDLQDASKKLIFLTQFFLIVTF